MKRLCDFRAARFLAIGSCALAGNSCTTVHRARLPYRPCIEALESRIAPTTDLYWTGNATDSPSFKIRSQSSWLTPLCAGRSACRRGAGPVPGQRSPPQEP